MAGKIMELAIAIKGKLDGTFTSSAKQAASSIKDLDERFRQLNRTSNKANAWVAQAQHVRNLAMQMRQAQSNVQGAAQAVRASESPSNAAAQAYENAQNQVRRLNNALTQSREKLHQSLIFYIATTAIEKHD